MASELSRAADDATLSLPITAVCIVADKNKCPKSFTPIIKSTDDSSDADLWRESAFSIFSRPVRYLAVCREIPEGAIKGAPISVVTDITVVKDSDPIPHGFVAIDYTADSKEKALRKRFICIKTEPRDGRLDAVGEVCILNRTKKTPKGFTSAGEVDGALIVFRVVVIPPTFGITQSASAQSLPSLAKPSQGLYPGLDDRTARHSASDMDHVVHRVNAFTIKSPLTVKPKGVDGVPLNLHPSLMKGSDSKLDSRLPTLSFDIRRLESDDFRYNFALERATLSNFA